MAQYECYVCDKNLRGHPKIKVEGAVYCYSCAKEVVAAEDRVTEQKQANDLKVYEAKVAKWENWKKNLESALPSKTTRQVMLSLSCRGNLVRT